MRRSVADLAPPTPTPARASASVATLHRHHHRQSREPPSSIGRENHHAVDQVGPSRNADASPVRPEEVRDAHRSPPASRPSGIPPDHPARGRPLAKMAAFGRSGVNPQTITTGADPAGSDQSGRSGHPRIVGPDKVPVPVTTASTCAQGSCTWARDCPPVVIHRAVPSAAATARRDWQPPSRSPPVGRVPPTRVHTGFRACASAASPPVTSIPAAATGRHHRRPPVPSDCPKTTRDPGQDQRIGAGGVRRMVRAGSSETTAVARAARRPATMLQPPHAVPGPQWNPSAMAPVVVDQQPTTGLGP